MNAKNTAGGLTCIAGLVYVTVEGFVAIGYITGIECISFGGALAKNQTYRAFVARPSHVLDLNGELLDGATVWRGLRLRFEMSLVTRHSWSATTLSLGTNWRVLPR